jgi:MOSC domain-containing protein YiiM
MELLRFYISPGHSFYGRRGMEPLPNPVEEVGEIHCVAGAGIRGDRFFNYREDFKGQITFFADETYQSLCEQFNVHDKPPSVFRRNIITRGVDLNSLIGREFEAQGVRFLGTEHCAPCLWMNQAFCAGAEAALKNRGGLRAKILTGGILRLTAVAQCAVA